MPNKPRLDWNGPILVNGDRNWYAPQLPYNFLIHEMPEGAGYTASYMNLDNLNMAGREIKEDPETGNVTSPLRKPEELPAGAKHAPVMIGGAEGETFPSLEAAQVACEDQARAIRREIRNAQVDHMLRKGAPKRP
jgi:hypothetical protein